MFSESDGVVRRLHTVVTCAALLMFAWLTVRHVVLRELVLPPGIARYRRSP